MFKSRVAIVYRSIPQYRKGFYERLRTALALKGIELRLIYGQASDRDATKKDLVDLQWATRIENRIYHFGNRELYWQPCLPHLKDIDLVVVEQASKLLVNYVLLARQYMGGPKVALWGHGENFQRSSASNFAEVVKRFVSRRPHWWFAYNDLSSRIVQGLGYPADRITSVQNAIDTNYLLEARAQVTVHQIEKLRVSLGLEGRNVAVYCGGMYKEKRLDFLLESCVVIRRKIPDFEVVFVGGGPEQGKVEGAAQKYPWIRYVGPKFDGDRVPYFLLSKLYLMPGLVGLGILDSFALGTPLVTTDVEDHSPEIDYLVHEENGLMTLHEVSAYAAAVTALLQQEDRRRKLVEGGLIAAQRYTLDAMVQRFADGVEQALGRV